MVQPEQDDPLLASRTWLHEMTKSFPAKTCNNSGTCLQDLVRSNLVIAMALDEILQELKRIKKDK